MGRHLGVGRVVAERREEQVREAHSAKDTGSGRAGASGVSRSGAARRESLT